uniref:Uncharacterized protein n=1 Tax=Pararge aegeria TaxID=116150 RepID=S4NTG6_9NEOP
MAFVYRRKEHVVRRTNFVYQMVIDVSHMKHIYRREVYVRKMEVVHKIHHAIYRTKHHDYDGNRPFYMILYPIRGQRF